jgi:hypothetical protein
VEQPPRELERARRQLLDQWASIEGEGLQTSSSWGATSGWNRYEPRTSPTPQAPAAPSAPPVFGGAALERIELKPRPISAPVSLMAPEDLVPIEPVSETVSQTVPPIAALPPPHSTPPTPPPMVAASRPPPPPAPPPPQPRPAAQPITAKIPVPVVAVTSVGKVGPPAPPKPPAALEDQFFSDTEGKGSQPISLENPIPIRQNRTWALVIIAGLALGIIVGIILAGSNPGETPTVVDSGVTVVVEPIDAGAPIALMPDDEDAGEEELDDDAGAVEVATVKDAGVPVAIAVIDAGAPKDAGVALAVAPKDAGTLVVVATIDAGVAAKDAGAAIAVEVKDAGAAIAVAPKDAGVQVAVAPKDAGVAVAADAISKLVDDANAAVVGQKYRKAVQLCREALKLAPDNASLRSSLGIALVMSDMGYKEAIPYLKDTVKDDATNAQAWLALGIAFQNLGRDGEAKAPYREFLKLKPRGAQADEVRAALQAIP